MIQVLTNQGMKTLPREGSYWKHRNGNIYQVKEVSNESDRQGEYPVTITYVGPNGKKWSKTAFKWFDKMTPLTDVVEETLLSMEGQVLDNSAIRKICAVWYGMMQQAGDGDGSDGSERETS